MQSGPERRRSFSAPEEEYAARSFRVNGFKDIVFVGDSGGNQQGMKAVAEC
jgi:hypothetical protein